MNAVAEIPTPRELAPYVQALGVDRAIDFFLSFGGATLYIAANPSSRSSAAAVIGVEGVKALYAALSGRETGTQNVRIPLGKSWIARQMRRRGKSQGEIARLLHSSDETVRRWLAADEGSEGLSPAKKSSQLSLF